MKSKQIQSVRRKKKSQRQWLDFPAKIIANGIGLGQFSYLGECTEIALERISWNLQRQI